ncbi:MAG: hypothetical protein AAGD05_15955, partial [Bacteroidota bacterium]
MIEQFEQSLTQFSTKKKDDEQAIESLLDTVEQLSKVSAPRDRRKKRKEPVFVRERKLGFSVAHNVEVNNPVETWNYDHLFIYIKPWSLKGTVNAIKYMEAANAGIKGVGSRHSYSKVVEADHCYIELSDAHPYDGSTTTSHNNTLRKLDQRAVKRLKKEVLANGRRNYYFDVPAGMTIGELNQVLGPDSNRKKSYFSGQPKRLFNMGGGDVQAFAGAFSTGTHGTGGVHSAYHDMVRSILLVASGGRIFRIEPEGEGAITDPAKHERFYANKA